MSLLTALIVKNSHILAGICFIFLKRYRILNLKNFQYQIWVSVTRSGKYLLSKSNFKIFLHISCSNFRLNIVKNLRVRKSVNQMKFERAPGELEAKNCLWRQPFTKYLRQTLVFMWNSALREKFNFFFAVDFC